MKISPAGKGSGIIHGTFLSVLLGIVVALLTIVPEMAVTPLEKIVDFSYPYESFLGNDEVRQSSINAGELCSLTGSTGTPPDHRDAVLLSRNPDSPHMPEPDRFDRELSKGKFLIASRKLGDPRFQETVVLLVSYDKRGAAGLVINRPVRMSLSDAFPDSPMLRKKKDTVYFGGPVELDRLLMLIRSPGRLPDAAHVFDGVYVSSSRDVFERVIGKPKTGGRFRVYAGYAGWAAGQLEREVGRGDWHVIEADAKTIFEKKPEKIWPELIRRGSELQVRFENYLKRTYLIG